MLTDDVFIFSEVVHCGLIGRIAYQTFHKFHNRKLHLYGKTDDLLQVEYHPNNIYHVLDDKPEILEAFQAGHKGTSKVWTQAILEAKEKYLIHIDSDVVFRGDAVEEVIQKLGEYDLVGPIRPYPNNPNKRDDVRHLPDVVGTYCFGFNKDLIPVKEPHLLERLVENSLDHAIIEELRSKYPWYQYVPTIDYFDPVSFIMLQHRAKICILDKDVLGGFAQDGSKTNKYGDLNKDCDFGDKIVHFASVGSGLNFVRKIQEGKPIQVPQWYVEYALGKLDLYLRLFYKQQILPDDKSQFLRSYDLMKKNLSGLV